MLRLSCSNLTGPASDTAIIRRRRGAQPVITAKMINAGYHRHTDVKVDSRAESDVRLLGVIHRFTWNIDVKRIANVTKNGVENELTETVSVEKIQEAGKLIFGKELYITFF